MLSAAISLIPSIVQAQTFGNYSTISNVSSSACPSKGGAHIIVARASQEPLGYGIIGGVKDAVIAKIPASNAEYVVYPATLNDYFNSEPSGVLGMKALVEAYLAKDCPNNAPLVLMGYSQGAQVVADYLSGQNVQGFAQNSSIDTAPPASTLARVAAVVIMGDPSINITSNPFHVGNSTQSGLFSRHANSSDVFTSSGLASRMQSYCDALDPYCASAGNFDHISVHLLYVPEYGANATSFVVNKINEYYANATSNGTATGTATGSATQTASGTAAATHTGAAAVVSVHAGGMAFVAMAMAGAFIFGC